MKFIIPRCPLVTKHRLLFLWPKWCEMNEGKQMYAGELDIVIVPF